MKICFLAELDNFYRWDDGLRGAMQILEKKHEVCYHLTGSMNENCLNSHYPDVIFVWGGTLSKPYNEVKEFHYGASNPKKCLFFAGGPRDPELFEKFDMVFFENKIHELEAKTYGVKCIQAFGTNTQVFKPMKQPKVFDVIYPGAFGLWKRKDLFAKAVKGLNALTLGNIQEHEPECFDVCVENDICVSADIPQSRLSYFYAMSHSLCVLPVAEIGGQRTVLEAMAMKMPVIVPSDAPLVCEFVNGFGTIVNPDPTLIRLAILTNKDKVNEKGYQYVMENFTEVHYAKAIEKGLERI